MRRKNFLRLIIYVSLLTGGCLSYGQETAIKYGPPYYILSIPDDIKSYLVIKNPEYKKDFPLFEGTGPIWAEIAVEYKFSDAHQNFKGTYGARVLTDGLKCELFAGVTIFRTSKEARTIIIAHKPNLVGVFYIFGGTEPGMITHGTWNDDDLIAFYNYFAGKGKQYPGMYSNILVSNHLDRQAGIATIGISDLTFLMPLNEDRLFFCSILNNFPQSIMTRGGKTQEVFFPHPVNIHLLRLAQRDKFSDPCFKPVDPSKFEFHHDALLDTFALKELISRDYFKWKGLDGAYEKLPPPEVRPRRIQVKTISGGDQGKTVKKQ